MLSPDNERDKQYNSLESESLFPKGDLFLDRGESIALSRAEWEGRFEAAVKFMESRESIPRCLIEIAAQHPLIDGRTPNEEFQKRLQRGVELYKELVCEGNQVEIYVPGSRHCFNGIADDISLSEAGRAYLLQEGLPTETIRGDDLNTQYKGEAGVYNSADECLVTSSHFRDGQFGQLHSVVSPVQLMRKTMHYIWFGVLPLNHTAPTSHTYHNYLQEVLDAIPHVMGVDPTLQQPNSAWGSESRKQRRPTIN